MHKHRHLMFQPALSHNIYISSHQFRFFPKFLKEKSGCVAYPNHALHAYIFRNPYFYVFLFVYHILSHSVFCTPMKLIAHALQAVFVFQTLKQVYGLN